MRAILELPSSDRESIGAREEVSEAAGTPAFGAAAGEIDRNGDNLVITKITMTPAMANHKTLVPIQVDSISTSLARIRSDGHLGLPFSSIFAIESMGLVAISVSGIAVQRFSKS